MVVANAAGMVKRPEHVVELSESAVTRVVVGSLTLEARPGNLGETYYYDPVSRTAWNSKGLDNLGVEEAIWWLPEMRDLLNRNEKELAVSIAGYKPEEYSRCVEVIAPWVDRIEVNLGCPNVWHKGVKKPVVSYDPSAVLEILGAVGSANRYGRPCSVKYSPVGDELVDVLAFAVSSYDFVDELIVCNTIPDQEGVRRDGSPALAFRTEEGGEVKHTGGMSGSPLKSHRRRLTRLFRNALPGRMKVITVGGIDSGQDILDCIEDGADGFMVGTHFFEHGPGVFSQILQEAV